MIRTHILGLGLLAVLGCQTSTNPERTTVARHDPTVATGSLIPSARGVTFATFVGGSGIDELRDVAEGPGGRLYAVGGSESGNFPMSGGFDPSFGGSGDGVVAAFGPAGQRLWSTYLGGSGNDEVLAIEVAPDGALIVAGRAGPGLPAVNAGFQPDFAGGGRSALGPQDGFVCKISSDGRRLYWCSYLGTGDDMAVADVAVDQEGSIYLAASIESGSYPKTWFAHAAGRNRKGGRDGVLVKVRANGFKVEWATYIAGKFDESARPSVRVAASGDVYYATATASRDLPVTLGVAQPKPRGGIDAWIGRFSSQGVLQWGTYYGGTSADVPANHGLAIDRFGRVYLAGSTLSRSLPGTASGFQPTFSGAGGANASRDPSIWGDGFLALLSAGGRAVVAATFVGGENADGVEALSIDVNGVVWVAGATYSRDLRITAGAHQQTFIGGRDGFTAGYSPDLATLVYGTFFGSSADDDASAIVGRFGGGALVVGAVSGSEFPTMGASQPYYGGNPSDGMVIGIR